MLCIVGAGLSSEYLSLRALSRIMTADIIYIDTYTSIAPGVDEEFISRLNPRAKTISAKRSVLEEESAKIIEEARQKNVVIVVPGDPFTATTHITLRLEALKAGVETCAIPGVSGLQAVIGATGLQVYRFGKTITLVYPEGFKPYSVIEAIYENQSRNMHTLVLLDLRLEEGRAMRIPEAVRILLSLEEDYCKEASLNPILPSSILVGVARAGLLGEKCIAGTPSEVEKEEYPPPPHSIIVTAPKLHPIEEEALHLLCKYRGKNARPL